MNENLVQQYHDRNKRRGLAVIAAIMALALGLAAYLALTDSAPDTSKLGVHLLLDDGRRAWDAALWPAHLDHAARVGRFVTQLVRDDDLDPARWQAFLDLCAARGLVPILRLATTWDADAGHWRAPLPDADGTYTTQAARYAAFMAALDWPENAPRYVVVGNEPNRGDEWGGTPDPAAYARYLVDVAAALKTADPRIQVANAAFDPYAPHTDGQPFVDGVVYMDAERFMDAMTRAQPGVWDTLDAWASHSYPLDQAAPPWQQRHQVDTVSGTPNPDAVTPLGGVFNRGINSYRWEQFKLGRLGVRRLLPVLITETGWRADRVDAATLARYYDLALRGNDGRYPDLPQTGWTPWLRDALVVAVTPFALNGHPDAWDAHNWLDMAADGTITGTRPVSDLAAGLRGAGRGE